jgi:hypothetical protein
MSEPQALDPGYCIGCARPSESWACAGCRASLDQVVAMLHGPRGEIITTWLSIMTTDARLERDRAADSTTPEGTPHTPGAGQSSSKRPAVSEVVAEGAPAGPAVLEGAPAGPAVPEGAPAGPAVPEVVTKGVPAGPAVPEALTAPARENGSMNSEPPDATNDRLLALGLVIEWSATMERQIQDAFCALAGSEFSAAVAEGQSADWLIEKCEALADAHRSCQTRTGRRSGMRCRTAVRRTCAAMTWCTV